MIEVDNREVYSALLQLWSIQNSILQSFRAVFIASETFILALAGFTAGTCHTEPERGSVLILGLVLGAAWIVICWSRGFDDSYCRYQILKLESRQVDEPEKQVLTSFREFQNRWVWQKAWNLRGRVRPSVARLFLDLVLPALYIGCFFYFLQRT
jgi:hypothetical protein